MDRRVTGVALIAIGIVLSLLGTFSHDWFSAGQGDTTFEVGLRELRACEHGHCQTASITVLPVDSMFSKSGNVAYFGALVAGALAVLAGVLALARQRMNGPVSPARLAVAFYAAVIAGSLIFLIDKPEGGGLRTGMAPALAMGGAAFGAAGALLLVLEDRRPARAPAWAELPAGAAAPPPAAGSPAMTPGCPQCRGPLEWQGAHGRWYCPSCNAYPRV